MDDAVRAVCLYQCVTVFERVEECILVVPGSTVWDPDCEFMKKLVQLQTREERVHREAIQKGLESTLACPIFTGIAESEFRRGEETLDIYR
jgi:hypothetical protein